VKNRQSRQRLAFTFLLFLLNLSEPKEQIIALSHSRSEVIRVREGRGEAMNEGGTARKRRERD